MRHILILLISILLLSSFLTSCEKKEKILYGWKTSSGWEWKTIGDKNNNPQYKGKVENGKPNGLGIMTVPDGSKYVGEWKNGKYNGQGTFTFPDGSMYLGKWKDGERNGQEHLLFLMVVCM